MYIDAIKKTFSNVRATLPKNRKNREKIRENARKKLNDEIFENASIISAGSIGSEISNALGKEYRSPFVNCDIDRNDFVTLCENLEAYMSFLECTISNKATGEVRTYLMNGVLKTMTIFWPYALSRKKAEENFNRRKKRINLDKLILILDDRGLSEESLERFDKIKCFRKICLTSSRIYAEKYDCCQFLKVYDGMPYVGEYDKAAHDGVYNFEHSWDYVSFLNGTDK